MSAQTRGILLRAAEAADGHKLRKFLRADKALGELLQALPPKDDRRLWSALAAHAAQLSDAVAAVAADGASPPAPAERENDENAPAAGDGDDDDDGSERAAAAKSPLALLVEATVGIALRVLEDEKRVLPTAFTETVVALHDALLLLEDTPLAEVAPGIARVCEAYWLQERADRELVAAQTIPFLLQRSMQPEARPGEVKRVHALRAALDLFDLDSPESADLKTWLLRACIHPHYVQSPDGQRFIVHLFSVHVPLIAEIHATIRAQLPSVRKSLLGVYGDLYFRAWRGAAGAALVAIERECIQDLMQRAVHASVPQVALPLRQILHAFAAQKRQRGVDEMLHRLYAPILWRALRAANPLVRHNATGLLSDAFPVHDPDLSMADFDAVIQKQFGAIEALLDDPVICVREEAVRGVSRILCAFWEVIPAVIARRFLTRLVNVMAHDSRSSAVRAAVFRGMRELVRNPLAQPVLKKLLPRLSTLIHDSAERVRVEFLELLTEVRSIRAIRFFDVVPVDALLDRLTVDSDRLAAQITGLLVPSFAPTERPVSDQVQRALVLMQRNSAAGVVFFRNLHRFLSPSACATLALGLARLVRQALDDPSLCVEFDAASMAGPARSQAEDASAAAGNDNDDDDDDEPMEDVADGDADDANADSATAPQILTAREREGGDRPAEGVELLEWALPVVAALWESNAEILESEVLAQEARALHGELGEASLMRILAKYAMSSSVVSTAVYRIAALHPSSSMPNLKVACMESLVAMARKAGRAGQLPRDAMAPLLDCLCAWGVTKQILQLIAGALGRELHPAIRPDEVDAEPPKRKAGSKKSRRSGSVLASVRLSAATAARLLDLMLSTDSTRAILLEHVEQMVELVDVLQHYLDFVDARLRPPAGGADDDDENELSDDTLICATSAYVRILIHAAGTEMVNVTATSRLALPPGFLELVVWAAQSVVPLLDRDVCEFGDELGHLLLSLFADVVTLGLAADREILEGLYICIEGVLGIPEGPTLAIAQPLARLVYQLNYQALREEVGAPDAALSCFVSMLATMPQAQLGKLKPCIVGVLALHDEAGRLGVALEQLVALAVARIKTLDAPAVARAHFLVDGIVGRSPATAAAALKETSLQLSKQIGAWKATAAMDKDALDDWWGYLELLCLLQDGAARRNVSLPKSLPLEGALESLVAQIDATEGLEAALDDRAKGLMDKGRAMLREQRKAGP